MLTAQFFSQNVHFAVHLFAALVFFAVFWLSFDAWLLKRNFREFLKWFGYLLVSLSFAASATLIEKTLTGNTAIGSVTEQVAFMLMAAGFLGIILGQLLDPLQKVPKSEGIAADDYEAQKPEVSAPPEQPEAVPTKEPETSETSEKAVILDTDNYRSPLPDESTEAPQKSPPPLMNEVEEPKPAPAKKPRAKHSVKHIKVLGILPLGNISLTGAVLPFGALIISGLYLRRATAGLERHYRPVALAFLLLFLSQGLGVLAAVLQDSTNPLLHRAAADYGGIWAAEQILLVLSSLVLGKWVWGYLTRRFMSQLFMVFTTLTLAIFLVTTVCFSYLLVRNVRESSFDNLQTSAKVLEYAIDSKKAEIRAITQGIADNPAVVSALGAGDTAGLVTATSNYLEDNNVSSLVITNDSGKVLLRADDPAKNGDSLSSDTLIRRALGGDSRSDISTKEGVVAPIIQIRSATPVLDASGAVIGAAVSILEINNAFLDGIKDETGLESSIYAGDVRSATTFVSADGISRWVGSREANPDVRRQVIDGGEDYKGTILLNNREYLAVYAPLKDVDNTIVGMMFIGEPSGNVSNAAAKSIELTFIIAVVLLVLSVIPAYLIAKYIERQLT